MTKKRAPAAHQAVTDAEALEYHAANPPGKVGICATKPMATRHDLSLAYSPGVAAPVQAIADDPATVYDYTSRGNLVAVVTNGTAILGMGDLGPLAAKPVMEGKAVLFKRFADVNAVDIELDAKSTEELISAVRCLGPTFGGINLEDIKAPECFVIENTLKAQMDIPVFHDDQHGTAIIATAGLINALHLTGRHLKKTKMVCLGAGAAALATLHLVHCLGMPKENIILVDTKGVVHPGRNEGMNEWKEKWANGKTKARTLAEAMKDADVFFGLSAKDALSPEMVESMAREPIIFAMANPDPEIDPEVVARVRPDAIMATGRSDYPNQINNVLGFPYIFRGALDVRASAINDEMKLAAAHALAEMAREDVPDEVAAAYQGMKLSFGKDYIIPTPFDPRLISRIPVAVARAAMETGVARGEIEDLDAYAEKLSARLNPFIATFQGVFAQVRMLPRKVIFAEGEEDRMIRAANAYVAGGFGEAVLVGREDVILEQLASTGQNLNQGVEIVNARLSTRNEDYAVYLYERLQRQGFLMRDCQRLVNTDRNIFAACMVALGEADAMVTGLTRKFSIALENIRLAIDPKPGHKPIGYSVILTHGEPIIVADTSIEEMPDACALADIAEEAAAVSRRFGHTPRVALLSYSTFGHPKGDRVKNSRAAVAELDRRNPNFEYDGEMSPEVALSTEAMKLYPFCRLSGPANVLIMPAAHSASISTKLLQQAGGVQVIGPLISGFDRSVQIASMSATAADVMNLAVMAAYSSHA